MPNHRAIKHISSRDNAIVKSIAILAKSAPARRAGGLCLLEGEHLALSYVAKIGALETLVLRNDETDASRDQQFERFSPLIEQSKQIVALGANVFDTLSSLATPSGVLALANLPKAARPRSDGFVLALDDVQDPGNVGTLIRTAAAAGVQQVWLSKGSAFAWSVKTLRAAQGAHFHTQIVEDVDLARALSEFGGARAATLPHADGPLAVQSLFGVRFPRDVALVLSNEGHGLSPALAEHINLGLTIPMRNDVESLNVAVAGAIALFAIANRS